MALVDGISPLAGLGLAVLLAVALAEFAKFRGRAERGFNWLSLAGVWLVFAGTFVSGATLEGILTPAVWSAFRSVAEIIGWLFAFIGTLFVAYQVLIEK